MGTINKRTNEQWRKLIAECDASGLTQEQWCREHDINPNTLTDRANRLRRLDERAEQLIAERRQDWVEVAEQPLTSNTPGTLTIEYGRFRLTADAAYPAAALAALLGELARPC